jgi:hypothetical protein
MLPPVAANVLENNPKFKALYTNLAGSRLNADASTRLIKQQRAQADVEKVFYILANIHWTKCPDTVRIATFSC